MKLENISLWVKIISRLRILFGLMPTTIQSHRYIFLTKRHPEGDWQGFWSFVTSPFFVYFNTEKWHEVFQSWLKLAESEDHLKEIFFVALALDYTKGCEKLHREQVAEKWLSILVDARSENHRTMVAGLADTWLDAETPVHAVALKKRLDFTDHLVNRAITHEEARIAFCYISQPHSKFCRHDLYWHTPQFKRAQQKVDRLWKELLAAKK